MRSLFAMFVCLLLVLSTAAAQEGPTVNQSEGPPATAHQKLFFYTAGGNLDYICYATSLQPTASTSSIVAATNANPVSLTSVAHGFSTSARPSITISGGTGKWSAVNGTFIATVTGANTFTIPVDSTAFGAMTGSLVFKTRAPRMGQSVWAVQKYVYNVGGDLVGVFWVGGGTSMRNTCAAPAQYQ